MNRNEKEQKMKRAKREQARWIFTSLALMTSFLLVPSTPSLANVNIPTEALQACSVVPAQYCIESVGVQPVGQSLQQLQWIPTGSSGPSVSKSEGVVAGRDLPGRWSALGAFDGENYDGLYLEVKQANPFAPWIFADAKPTLSPGNSVKLATSSSSANYPVNLNPDVAISIKLRVGNFEPGVTFGVGTDGTITFAPAGTGNILGFLGYPVKVPLARSTRDCSGESGSAVAVVTQFNTIFVPKNDDKGYGIDGSTGRLYVGSNGICKLSTPSWIANSKTFSYKASGPKLSPDGKETNTGFYYAAIPFADAKALWGLERPQDAVSALVVSIKTSAGGSSGATKSVSVKNEHIVIAVSGFEFPDPSVDISLNPEYNSKGAVTGANNTVGGVTGNNNTLGGVSGNNNMSLAGGGANQSKVKTITCAKGNKTRKVTGVKPVCPKGWKKA
jgi:hypothetical protein